MAKKIIHNVTTGEITEVEITQAEMDQMHADEQARIAAISYTAWRSSEYPPFTDYLDGIVKSDQAQIQAYIDACLAVKAKYPKPE
jgi:hypothetical protein